MNLESLNGTELARLYLQLAKEAAELEMAFKHAERKRFAVYQAGLANCGESDFLDEITNCLKSST